MCRRKRSLQNRYQYFGSDHDMKQYVNTFSSKYQLFWFSKYTQNFEVTVCGATRVTGLKLPKPSHQEI